jgi:hypothetical protein
LPSGKFPDVEEVITGREQAEKTEKIGTPRNALPVLMVY